MELHQQYRNLDVARWPQEVRLEFERVTLTDPDPDLSWLDDESRYEDVTKAEAAKYRAADLARMEAYRRGEWEMLGVLAKVTAWVPIGGTSFSSYTLTSAGVYGVESDSGEDYLSEIYEDEKAQIVDALKAMGQAAAKLGEV